MTRRVTTISSGAVLVSALSLLTLGCSPASVTAGPPSASMVTSAGAKPATAAVLSRSLHVSVQSDAAMRAAVGLGGGQLFSSRLSNPAVVAAQADASRARAQRRAHLVVVPDNLRVGAVPVRGSDTVSGHVIPSSSKLPAERVTWSAGIRDCT
jgi:hypothetical protein